VRSRNHRNLYSLFRDAESEPDDFDSLNVHSAKYLLQRDIELDTPIMTLEVTDGQVVLQGPLTIDSKEFGRSISDLAKKPDIRIIVPNGRMLPSDEPVAILCIRHVCEYYGLDCTNLLISASSREQIEDSLLTSGPREIEVDEGLVPQKWRIHNQNTSVEKVRLRVKRSSERGLALVVEHKSDEFVENAELPRIASAESPTNSLTRQNT